jgi:oligosaccharide translocation protein RFT1
MEKPAEKENGEPAKQATDSSLLASSAKGASSLILLQLVSRMLTFTLNQMALKFISAETLGVASIKLELLLSTILFISREGFRTALLRGGNDCSDADKNEQKITNLAYIPTAIGLVTTILTCGYYISMIDPVSNVYPWYKTSIILYGLSAFLELLVEPLFTRALNGLNFQLRVNIEGVAVLLRCILTFALTVYGNDPKTGTNRFGVLAFAIAQFVFGLTMMTGYASYYLYKVKLGQIPSVKQLLPQPIEEKEK